MFDAEQQVAVCPVIGRCTTVAGRHASVAFRRSVER